MSKAPIVESDRRKREVSLAQMYPIIQEVLDSGGTFSLTVTGESMYPTILGGRDQATLKKAPDRLQKYDLPLYRRSNGQFVLHRIVEVAQDGTYTCCGDHQWQLERGLRQEQMIGVVTEITRKSRHFTVDSAAYRCWVRFWTAVLPLRHYVFAVQIRWIRCCNWVKRMFCRKDSGKIRGKEK